MMHKKYRGLIELILMILAVFGTFVLLLQTGIMERLKPETFNEKTIMWIGIFIMMFAILALHELGHLLMGLAQGFEFDLFIVGPLGIKREDKKIKVYLNKNLGYYGGVAGTSPKTDHPDNPKIMAKILLAGPIASLLVAIIFILLASYIGRPFGLVLFIGGVISIGIFYATTIPTKTGMFFTDRKRYQRLTTPGKAQDEELSLIRILGIFKRDESYKNIDKSDIKTLIDANDTSIQYFGFFNQLCYEIEVEKKIADSSKDAFDKLSLEMSSSMVSIFNKEIEKYKVLHLGN